MNPTTNPIFEFDIDVLNVRAVLPPMPSALILNTEVWDRKSLDSYVTGFEKEIHEYFVHVRKCLPHEDDKHRPPVPRAQARNMQGDMFLASEMTLHAKAIMRYLVAAYTSKPEFVRLPAGSFYLNRWWRAPAITDHFASRAGIPYWKSEQVKRHAAYCFGLLLHDMKEGLRGLVFKLDAPYPPMPTLPPHDTSVESDDIGPGKDDYAILLYTNASLSAYAKEYCMLLMAQFEKVVGREFRYYYKRPHRHGKAITHFLTADETETGLQPQSELSLATQIQETSKQLEELRVSTKELVSNTMENLTDEELATLADAIEILKKRVEDVRAKQRLLAHGLIVRTEGLKNSLE